MDLSGSYIFDIEGDSLTPTLIHCVSIHNLNSGKRVTLTDYDQMRAFFTSAKVLIGHNIIGFDVPVIERLLDIKVDAVLIDTLWISYYAYPERTRHGLDPWGETVGILKPKVDNWKDLPLEVYIHRCEEDVEINTRVWDLMYKKLFNIYGSEKEVMRFLKYLSFKAIVPAVQEKNKWEIDVEHVISEQQRLEAEKSQKIEAILPHMPLNPVWKTKTRPKTLYKKDGSLSVYGVAWNELLISEGYDPLKSTDVEEVRYIAEYEPGNLNSPDQVKKWLFSLGWEPQTFKTNAKKEEIPQVNLERGQGLCPSVKKLFEIEPALEYMEGISILTHRIGLLKAFLAEMDEDNFVVAGFSGITNTIRYQHKRPCCNLPKVGLAYSDGVRASLIAGKNKLLCGSDLSGLEDTIKQHFIYFYDPEYVKTMQATTVDVDGKTVSAYDPHLYLALHAGKITQEQYDDYVTKKDQKTIKPIRDVFKNGNYSLQYKAFPPTVARTCGISLEEATELFNSYWSLNSAITKTAESTTVKTLDDGSMWQKNPINGFWYSLRYEKDRFSTLVQGTASYIFDLWVGFIMRECDTLIGQFHDEFIARIDPDQEEWMEELVRNSLEKVNQYLKLNVELDCDVQFGQRYSEIH